MPPIKIKMGAVRKKLVFEEDEAGVLVDEMLEDQWNELTRVLSTEEAPNIDEYLAVVRCINVLEELRSDMNVSSAIRTA